MQRSPSGRSSMSSNAPWPFRGRALGRVRRRPDDRAARAAVALDGRRQHRRNLAVGRINDDRRAVLAVDHEGAAAAIDPEIVVAADVAADRWGVAVGIARPRAQLHALPLGALDLGRFGRRERQPPADVVGPLERRQRRRVPDALQIGMSPRRPRCRPGAPEPGSAAARRREVRTQLRIGGAPTSSGRFSCLTSASRRLSPSES